MSMSIAMSIAMRIKILKGRREGKMEGWKDGRMEGWKEEWKMEAEMWEWRKRMVGNVSDIWFGDKNYKKKCPDFSGQSNFTINN